MDNQRAIARMLQARREEELLNRHVRVVNMLRGNQCDEVIRYAKSEIERWRQQQLCSQDYIDTWDRLLNDPIQAAAILEERSTLGVRLRQNTPFAAYLGQLSGG